MSVYLIEKFLVIYSKILQRPTFGGFCVDDAVQLKFVQENFITDKHCHGTSEKAFRQPSAPPQSEENSLADSIEQIVGHSFHCHFQMAKRHCCVYHPKKPFFLMLKAHAGCEEHACIFVNINPELLLPLIAILF